jgi:hypothetical protein
MAVASTTLGTTATATSFTTAFTSAAANFVTAVAVVIGNTQPTQPHRLSGHAI